MGQPLVVEGQRGSQYYGYLYVNGKKKEGYISSKKVQPYTFDESFEKELTSFPDSYKHSHSSSVYTYDIHHSYVLILNNHYPS